MIYSGPFKPRNPQKYAGNVDNIRYRSSWERKMMDWLDKNPHILQWSSEELIIYYVSPKDGKKHRYFPDFVVKVKTRTGKLQTMVLEVKPSKESKPPKQQSRMTKKYINEVVTWGVNRAKWKAAIEFCKDRGWIFAVAASDNGTTYEYLTENDLILN